MEEIKYFSPDIEDFHVSYEYEVLSIGRIFDDFGNLLPNRKRDEEIQWRITKMINPSDLLHISISYDRNKIRCAYLTKEQIEIEGWIDITLSYQKEKLVVCEKQIGEYYRLVYNIKSHMLSITDCEDCSHFIGECKSINEFRYICKLLKI